MAFARWAILTDLDGTLLGARDFSFEAALDALRRLRERGIDVVPVTSKTAGELVSLAPLLGFDAWLVGECGGCGLERGSRGWRVHGWGRARRELEPRFEELRLRTGLGLRALHELDSEQAMACTGLAPRELRRALRRRWSVPFSGPPERREHLERAASTLGVHLARGGRLWHLLGHAGKDLAVERLREPLAARAGVAPSALGIAALGDAPMDAGMLRAADRAWIVPRSDGTPDPELVRGCPDAQLAPRAAPQGWAEAVEALL